VEVRDAETKEGWKEMTDPNTSIIEEFRASDGRVGGQFEDTSLILVHHIGAKSGTERVTPVSCFPLSTDGPRSIASRGGAPANPDWYYNLKAHPEIKRRISTSSSSSVSERSVQSSNACSYVMLYV
jgi:deazaflavin-dependent oxidoreductase (nitroreductase family)